MAASNTDDRDDDQPEEPTSPPDRSEEAGRDTNSRPEPEELADETVDARFADLVATLDDLDSGTGTTYRTATGDVSRGGLTDRGSGTTPQDGTSAEDTPDPDGPAPPATRATGPRDWPITPEVEALEEADSHFTPPEPEPLLNDSDPLLTMAWFAVAGIPVLALVAVITVAAIPTLHIPPLVGQVALGLFLGGLAILLWRMPHRRDPEDDDPGAIV